MGNNKYKEKFISSEYFVLYKKSNIFDPFSNEFLNGFSRIKNTYKSWAADPFVFEYNNKHYVFAELADRSTWKGDIACLCLDNKIKKWKTIISEDWHLSFPNVFTFNNEIVMMCESHKHSSIYFYKCKEFPFKWEKSNIPLIEGPFFVDSDIVKINNDYFLFTYTKRNGRDILAIYIITPNKTKLIQEINDPYKKLRLGGKIFTFKNKIYAPMQDCEKKYGDGIILYELQRSNSLFSFKKVKYYSVNVLENIYKYNINSFHTLNHDNKYIVIDASRNCLSLHAIIGRFKNKIRLLFKKPLKNYH